MGLAAVPPKTFPSDEKVGPLQKNQRAMGTFATEEEDTNNICVPPYSSSSIKVLSWVQDSIELQNDQCSGNGGIICHQVSSTCQNSVAVNSYGCFLNISSSLELSINHFLLKNDRIQSTTEGHTWD